MVTLAPGTTWRVASITDPDIDPEVVCAERLTANTSNKRINNMRCFISFPHFKRSVPANRSGRTKKLRFTGKVIGDDTSSVHRGSIRSEQYFYGRAAAKTCAGVRRRATGPKPGADLDSGPAAGAGIRF